MIHVVLDTNILRNHQDRKSTPFRALMKLVSRKELTINIPDLVEKEYQSQLPEIGEDKLKRLKKVIKEILKSDLLRSKHEQLLDIQNDIKENGSMKNRVGNQILVCRIESKSY